MCLVHAAGKALSIPGFRARNGSAFHPVSQSRAAQPDWHFNPCQCTPAPGGSMSFGAVRSFISVWAALEPVELITTYWHVTSRHLPSGSWPEILWAHCMPNAKHPSDNNQFWLPVLNLEVKGSISYYLTQRPPNTASPRKGLLANK